MATESAPVLYHGGRIFTADSAAPWAQALVVDGGLITFAGDLSAARDAAGPARQEAELGGPLTLPGFVDGHAHLLMAGEAQLRVPLTDAADLPEIQQRLAIRAKEQPDAPRVTGRGWLFSAVPGGHPTKDMLDEVVADRPVYLDANDYHSCWVNSAALAELGITASTPDPVGGRIARDAGGEATGFLEETAASTLVWPFLDSVATDRDRDSALAAITSAYTSSGVTTVVDMALDDVALAALERADQAATLDLRVIGHWLVPRGGSAADHLAEVERAEELARSQRSERLRIAGIKLVVDGVIDGCTAAMLEPYADGSNADPIWDLKALVPVVTAADAAGLQIAMHAIGDRAVRTALEALERAIEHNGPRERRHRIEHLEYVDRADIQRLADLGVTASMQPVHCDPAIISNWLAKLGDHRGQRGFAWPELRSAGALLAFGTDTPTAPLSPLHNMFIASTRRSALNPPLAPYLPHFALPLTDAIVHGTASSAWACRGDGAFGRLRPGLAADFVVLDTDPFADGPEALLGAQVVQTFARGTAIYRRAI
ncbi:MAG: amidohydrolase [Streptosporangiaceae bacterium]